jgi:hypothetical protein
MKNRHYEFPHLVRFEVPRRWLWRMPSSGMWPCRSYVNRRVGGTYHHHLQVRKIRERGTSVRRWLQTQLVFDRWLSLQSPAHAVSSLADFSTQKMEAIRSSEASVHTRSTRRHIPEDGILPSSCSILYAFFSLPTPYIWKNYTETLTFDEVETGSRELENGKWET